MTTFDAGRNAENAAAAFLVRRGCEVLAQNWRTRRCEIDIIARRGSTLYICEVKYRRHSRQGNGLDYITPQKLRRMRFAAECYVAAQRWPGPYQLCAIEVSGTHFKVTAALKLDA